MTTLLRSVLASVLFCFSAGAALAGPVSINFNDLAPGVNVTSQYSGLGATFSLVPSPTEPGSPLPSPNGPTVWSLGPVDQFAVNGNSIIVGPTTTGPFYDVQVDFDEPLDYFSIVALDAETLPLRVIAYSQGTRLSLNVTSTYLGDIGPLPYVSGPVYLLEIGQVGGPARFDRVVFGGTEQFDNLAFSLSFTPESALAELLNNVTGVGPGKVLERTVTQAQVYYAVPDVQATCSVMRFFDFEVRVTWRLSQATRRSAPWKITTDQMDDLLGQSGSIQIAIGCN